jgi:hypothetical protein
MSSMDRRLTLTLVGTSVLALGAVGAGALIGRGVENAKTGDRGVTVRGLSERIVKADLAVLPLRFAAAGDSLAEVQAKVDANLLLVRRFLAQEGYAPSEIDLGRFEVVDQLAREYQQAKVGARYQVAQTVIVRTANVDRVQATTRRLNELVRQGVVLQDFRGPSYLFTKLNDVRPQMIGEATASARSGAEQFARDSRSHLTGISAATQGSFQILGRDQIGEGASLGGDGGSPVSDEASQIFKKVRVVTTITYSLR